ncbi:MAG TPA: class I SAM-dependent methyltransferase [Thermotogota bacterium]|nr:class I SAM-dependent methyltransferase [Thermotogota bacterium]HRW91982.1 class I SAM-dependent methyltransferase [Thermotogota bacterium]
MTLPLEHPSTERFVVTTANKPDSVLTQRARQFAHKIGVPFVSRRHFPSFLKEHPQDFFYVFERERLVIRRANETFFFHPGSAVMRMRNFKQGQEDYLLQTMQLTGTESVLDLTLGLGNEAILLGAFLPEGRVVGVEGSQHIFHIVQDGWKNYTGGPPWVLEAMKRVSLVHKDYRDLLRELPEDAYDIVYCDPMFENPVMSSSGLNPLRPFALYDPMEPEDVEQMKRVARKKVILKALEKDSLFSRIAVDTIQGSRHSGVMYGVIVP